MKAERAKPRFHLEKKVYAQVRFFEELTLIKDDHGEVLFTGSKIMADKILRMLNRDTQRSAPKSKPKRRPKPRRRK